LITVICALRAAELCKSSAALRGRVDRRRFTTSHAWISPAVADFRRISEMGVAGCGAGPKRQPRLLCQGPCMCVEHPTVLQHLQRFHPAKFPTGAKLLIRPDYLAMWR
jgi:hypothetical protein